MILVTGATGTNGREVLQALAARGATANAMVRSPKQGGDLPPGITAVQADFDDAASLGKALAGVERAFLLTPSTEHAQAQRDKGMIAAPIGDARVSVVDVRDNAMVAACALTEQGHAGKTYTLTGPEALTHAEMAAKLSASTGRPIVFVDASEDDMRHAMAGVKRPDWQIEGLIEDYAHYRRGEAAEIAPGVRDATGQAPRAFDGFARDHADAFEPT